MSVHATIPIEKGVPIPPACRTRVTVGYDFGSMEVGDSFFRAVGEGVATNLQRSILAAAGHWQKKTGLRCKFTTRQLVENGVVGIRCWRTE